MTWLYSVNVGRRPQVVVGEAAVALREIVDMGSRILCLHRQCRSTKHGMKETHRLGVSVRQPCNVDAGRQARK